ncbi:HipA domain-containing protein [Rhizobium sp. YTU87027]|uniref:HipA domain-containing protein n=1 Tax=Rhizobium sp. YTU87027 TaxID=3417741 RepID=UPI003D68E4C9
MLTVLDLAKMRDATAYNWFKRLRWPETEREPYCDGHLKNFSLLETPTGLRLSPAYDVVNTALYDGFDQTLALSFGGNKVHLEAADQGLFRSFGKTIGLPEAAVNQSFKQMKRQVEKATSIIQPPEVEPPDGFMHRFKEIVDNSCLRILEA